MNYVKYLILLAVLLISPLHASAEVIAIEPNLKGPLFSAAPIMTMYWHGQKAKALIIYFPGGDGRVGIKAQTKDLRSPFYYLMKNLSMPNSPSGKYDVVVFDSPYELSWPSQRSAIDHLSRIDSAIEYYKKKTGLPIWVMGHSNGVVSVTGLISYLQEKNKLGLIAGIIVSGAQNDTYFSPPLSTPILFIHHEEDACINTQPKLSYDAYKKVKEFDKANVEFIYIQGGEYELNDPCTSGYHMYNNADGEVIDAIDGFISRQLHQPYRSLQ